MTIAGLSLTDPTNGGSLSSAVSWASSLLTGTLATTTATIAVAAIGFLMLQGRLPLRRGLITILGCFIVFGAATIGNGLLVLSADINGTAYSQTSAMGSDKPAPSVAPPPQSEVYDPYAGASIPIR